MKHDHFVVQSPDKPAQQLLLLFHGVGDNPVAMGEIGSWFAPLFPDALVVSVGGAEAEQDAVGKAKPDPNSGEQQEAEAALAEQQ